MRAQPSHIDDSHSPAEATAGLPRKMHVMAEGEGRLDNSQAAAVSFEVHLESREQRGEASGLPGMCEEAGLRGP